MPVLYGAIAYRASRVEQFAKEISSWEFVRQSGSGAGSASVACPRCGEAYELVEGVDASEELAEEDKTFLAKALGSAHPVHPARVVIRDPEGVIGQVLDCLLGSSLMGAAFEEQIERFYGARRAG